MLSFSLGISRPHCVKEPCKSIAGCASTRKNNPHLSELIGSKLDQAERKWMELSALRRPSPMQLTMSGVAEGIAEDFR